VRIFSDVTMRRANYVDDSVSLLSFRFNIPFESTAAEKHSPDASFILTDRGCH
jgi:hypothetical protein